MERKSWLKGWWKTQSLGSPLVGWRNKGSQHIVEVVLCKVTFSNHTLPGGEGESEEEEEDESVAELKKPNSDEVGASKRTDGLFDWLVLGRFMD